MVNPLRRRPLFEGLVFNEQGQAAEATYIGNEPCYIILDRDFCRHVESEAIDRQVIEALHKQMLEHQEIVTRGVLDMLGQDDLFTKAMVDSSIANLDKQIDLLLQQGLPDGARAWLGLTGFRVVVNVHGQVVRLDSPQSMARPWDEDE